MVMGTAQYRRTRRRTARLRAALLRLWCGSYVSYGVATNQTPPTSWPVVSPGAVSLAK
jgi:hypothetical protein